MIDPSRSEVSEGARLALRMIALQQKIDRDQLEFAQLAAAYKKTDHWDQEGFNTALDWIRIHCRLTSTAAGDRLAVGERLAELGRRWRRGRSASPTSP